CAGSAAARAGDLLEESHVGIVEYSDIRDLVTADRDAPRPHAERPTRVPLAVDAGGLEDAGMHHARAQDLDPARALARGAARAAADAALHVHLGRRLRERKERRAEARA